MSGDSCSEDTLRGSCLAMCPPEEIRIRQRTKRVHAMECRPSTSDVPRSTPLQGTSSFFVKEFSRSSAGRKIKPSDVRPLPVLSRTLRYLLTVAYPRKDLSMSVVHEFVGDRIRAIRQDLAVQDLLCVPSSAPLLAAVVRFYTLQQYLLCEIPTSEFDPFLNMKQLQESLASLIRIYKDQETVVKHLPSFSFELDELEDDFYVTVNTEDNKTYQNKRKYNVPRYDGDREEVASVLQRISGLTLSDMPSCSGTGPLNGQSAVFDQDDDKEYSESQSVQSCDQTDDSPDDNSKELEQESPVMTRTPSTSKDEKNRENQILEAVSKMEAQSSWTNVRESKDLISSDEESSKPESSENCDQVSEREEMEALNLLLNYDNTEVIQHCLELPDEIKTGSLLSKIIPVMLSYLSSGNYIPLLRLFNILPPILSVTFYLSLPKIQKKAIQVLATGHSSVNTRFAVAELSTLLMFENVAAASTACQHYGFKIVGEDEKFVAFHKKDLKPEQPVIPLSKAKWIDARIASSPLDKLLLPHSLK